MNKRFTDLTIAALRSANDEALRLGHEQIDVEHILLGLLAGHGTACVAFERVWNCKNRISSELEKRLVPGVPVQSVSGKLRRTGRADAVIEHAAQEAKSLGHNYLGTEHLLLGLLHDEGTAAQVLNDSGITLAVARREILAMLIPVGK